MLRIIEQRTESLRILRNCYTNSSWLNCSLFVRENEILSIQTPVKLGFLSLTAKPNPDKHGFAEFIKGFCHYSMSDGKL